jgi:hypothetical protein
MVKYAQRHCLVCDKRSRMSLTDARIHELLNLHLRHKPTLQRTGSSLSLLDTKDPYGGPNPEADRTPPCTFLHFACQ